MKDRVIALAALLQGCSLARQIAATGDGETQPLTSSIGSVFAIDAESPAAVYGGTTGVARGMRLLLAHLDGAEARDPAVTRMAVTVLHLERRFAARTEVVGQVRRGIEEIRRQVNHLGMTHPVVLERLGELYAATVSTLRPRILVQGNPAYLGQATVVAEIRAVLLASLRAAVLWRQLGGTYWDLLLRRSAMAHAAQDHMIDA